MHVRLYSVPVSPVGKVSVMARPRGDDWLEDEIKSLRQSGVDILVSLLTSEEERELHLVEEEASCRAQGIAFFSLPIIDHSIPPFSADTFAFLERLSAPLAEGKHIALHCRQGLGRSVMMAACLLVLAGYSAEWACAQLSLVRGYQVPETAEQRAWVEAFSQARSKSAK